MKNWKTITANIKQENYEIVNRLLTNFNKSPNQFAKQLFEMLSKNPELLEKLINKTFKQP